jgi:hypothetical protein
MPEDDRMAIFDTQGFAVACAPDFENGRPLALLAPMEALEILCERLAAFR